MHGSPVLRTGKSSTGAGLAVSTLVWHRYAARRTKGFCIGREKDEVGFTELITAALSSLRLHFTAMSGKPYPCSSSHCVMRVLYFGSFSALFKGGGLFILFPDLHQAILKGVRRAGVSLCRGSFSRAFRPGELTPGISADASRLEC